MQDFLQEEDNRDNVMVGMGVLWWSQQQQQSTKETYRNIGTGNNNNQPKLDEPDTIAIHVYSVGQTFKLIVVLVCR
jgi:hypothetical protein